MTASKPSHLPAKDPARPQLIPVSEELLGHVQVDLCARLGRGKMSVAQLMHLSAGEVVVLETALADSVDLYLGDALVARGEIVAVGDNYGVRIVEIASGR